MPAPSMKFDEHHPLFGTAGDDQCDNFGLSSFSICSDLRGVFFLLQIAERVFMDEMC